MKIINKLCIAVIAVFTMQACSDDFYDVNASQNDPTFSTPQLTLPVAQKYTAEYISGEYLSVNTLGNLWGYTWAAAGNYIYFVDETTYNVTSSFRTGTFQDAYMDCLVNYNYVENYGVGAEDAGVEYDNFHAIAKIMKAYHFQVLVDIYGAVPYSEAFQAPENLTPVYDSGKDVYDGIYDELNVAIDMIDAGLSNADILPVGSSDVMLGGDMAMWAKFANTIKLRILIRQSETGADLSSKYAELAANPYGLLGAGETVFSNVGYSQDVDKQNPLWNGFGETVAGDPASNNEATRATDYVIQKLEDFNDPRLDDLYAPAKETGTFVGIAQNQNQVNANAPQTQFLSGVGPGVLVGPEQDAIIFSSYESLFLQAEAAQRGLLAGNAQSLYEAAIAESFLQLNVTFDDDADPDTPEVAVDPATYYNQPIENVGWTASSDEIEAIITQKWIALNGTNGLELWLEYKRTGFPSDLPAAEDAFANTIPVRLFYPTSEYSTNTANVPDITDAFNQRVFWDIN